MAWASWALQDFTDSRIFHFQTHASLILNGWRLKLAGGSPPWPSPTSTRTTKASTRCAWSPKEAPQSIVPLSLSQVRPPGWTPPCIHVCVYPACDQSLMGVTRSYFVTWCRWSSAGSQCTRCSHGHQDPRCQQRLRHCVMEAAEHHHRGTHPGILCGQVRESQDDHHKEINQKHNGKLLKVIMEAAASASQEISEHLIFTLPVLCWKHRCFTSLLFFLLPLHDLSVCSLVIGAKLELRTGPSATITPLRSVNTQCPACSKDTPTTSEWERSTRMESAKPHACRTPSLPWTPLSLRSFTVGWTGIPSIWYYV